MTSLAGVFVTALTLAAAAQEVSREQVMPLRLGLVKRTGFDKDRRDTINLANLADTGYYTYVSIGTSTTPEKAPQEFLVQVDTGSSALWVGSKDCNQSRNCNDRHAFDPSTSSTFKDVSNGNNVSISFQAGKVTGSVVQDTIFWNGITLPDQQFLLVHTEDEEMKSLQAGSVDGMLGLACQATGRASASYFPSILGAIMNTSLSDTPVFSLWLNGTSGAAGVDLMKGGGEIFLGGVDSSRFQGQLQYYPVIDSYFWGISVNTMTVNISGSFTRLRPFPSGSTAILDSGTSVIYLETDYLQTQVVPLIYTAINTPAPPMDQDSRLWLVECGLIQYLPNIGFNFGDNTIYELSWSDYILTLGPNRCALGFSPAGTGAKANILGDIFLRKFYSVYDYGSLFVDDGRKNHPRVGLAVAVGNAKHRINLHGVQPLPLPTPVIRSIATANSYQHFVPVIIILVATLFDYC
ncbi:acid protease [Rhizoclosmatium globosum]|uniref:rhizopuspepsin n=1 Tax=Rhizoclosmatium globosum TaxID=329046 RepID=A0A1Y2CWD3_9FUNG|nr:acid protease [Rhizoclosmatium globosum]|eukprot:ORY51330.1 acid protease [Rhizoclosmatium globosum]